MIHQGDTILNTRTGQQMTFLKTWGETNGTQLEIDCISPAGGAREHIHIHPYQENRFTLLEGELVFTANGTDRKVKAGETISVPKNIPHAFYNAGTTNARYIQEFFPALKTDALFETFFALERDGKLNKKGSPNILRTAVIMLYFKNELRLAKPGWLLQKTVFTLFMPIGKLLGYKATYTY